MNTATANTANAFRPSRRAVAARVLRSQTWYDLSVMGLMVTSLVAAAAGMLTAW